MTHLLGLGEQLNRMKGAQQCGGGWLALSPKRGQDSASAISLGGPSQLLAEGRHVEGWEGSALGVSPL